MQCTCMVYMYMYMYVDVHVHVYMYNVQVYMYFFTVRVHVHCRIAEKGPRVVVLGDQDLEWAGLLVGEYQCIMLEPLPVRLGQ